jgi:molybdenum cofactor cytidylyltransferase
MGIGTSDHARIGVVLLAAGESRRMGSAKQLLAIRDKPMVRRAAETALAAACGPVFVVVGAHAEQVRASLAGLPVRVVDNPKWAEGIGASVAAGTKEAASADFDALIVMLADQPSVTPAIIRRLATTYRFLDRPIVASSYAGAVGAPALISRELFPELLELSGDQGCRSVILRNRGLAVVLDCPQAAVDLDTPEEYSAWVSAAAGSTDR